MPYARPISSSEIKPIPDQNQGLFLFRQLEESAAIWRWVVPLSNVTRDHLYSPDFTVGKWPWKLLIFERESAGANFLSYYLALADYQETVRSGAVNYQPREANFQLKIVNKDPLKDEVKRCEHIYTWKETDWGYNEFVKWETIRNPDNGFVFEHNGTPTLLFEVTIKDNSMDIAYLPNYDSKKETGYVGLRNQGATCYLNSLLQTLFHLTVFRKSVYQMPISDTKRVSSTPGSGGLMIPKVDEVKPIPLALQRLFYNLQYSKEAVKTEELTKSFGWTQLDSFTQHDIQELNRVLCDNLENKMKGTTSEGTMQKLFVGKVRNYIRCNNVPYENTVEEDFYDIQLCVSGCNDIYSSFLKELQPNSLDGDNKYNAGPKYGLQDAKKGIHYLHFPPVLMLHLKRFEYDIDKGSMKKLIDEYKFYEEINLGQFISRRGSDSPDCYNRHPNADPLSGASADDIWVLHSVLVHCGSVHGGHYYAFCKMGENKQWLKFDDDKVSKATATQATVDNFGGKDKDKFWLTVHTIPSAYMLVYVQKSQWRNIVYPFRDEDVPEPLKEVCEREARDKERAQKEKLEEHLYYYFRVATEQAIMQQHDRNNQYDIINFDLLDENENIFKIRKTDTWASFQKLLSIKFRYNPSVDRVWKWTKRSNKTYRPDSPIHLKRGQSDQTPLREIIVNQSSSSWQVDKIDILIENCKPNGLTPEILTYADDTVFLLFKFYDYRLQKLSYVGQTIVKGSAKLSSLIPFMCSLARITTNLQLLAFEEIRLGMVEKLDLEKTLRIQELQHGDIIVFQVCPSDSSAPLAYAPDLYKYIDKRVFVKFAHKDKPTTHLFNLELSRDMDFQSVCFKLCETGSKNGIIRSPPTHIRLFAFQGSKHKVFPSSTKQLKDMLAASSAGDILLFEELPISLAEYENKRILQVAFYNNKVQEVDVVKLLLEKTATVKDALRQLRSKLNIPGDVHLMEVESHEIRKIYKPTDSICVIPSSLLLRAEQIMDPSSEGISGPARTVPVVHVDSRTSNSILQYHGSPFLIYVMEHDTIANVKDRIISKLDMKKSDEFKLCLIMGSQVFTLQEGDTLLMVVSELKERYPHNSQYGWTIGMDHKDPKKRVDKVQSSIVIYN